MKVRYPLVLLLLSVFQAVPSWAQQKPSLIDFTVVLTAPNGQPIIAGDGKTANAPPLTLEMASIDALDSVIDEDRQATGLDKFKRDQVARTIYAHPKGPSLSVEEVTLIKERIGKVYGPAVIGAAWPLLDPQSASPAR